MNYQIPSSEVSQFVPVENGLRLRGPNAGAEDKKMKAYLVRNVLREFTDSCCKFSFHGDSFNVCLFDAEVYASDYEDFSDKIRYSEGGVKVESFESLYGLSGKMAAYNKDFPVYKNSLVATLVAFFTAFDGDCDVSVHSVEYSSGRGAKGFVYFPFGGYCSFQVVSSNVTASFYDEHEQYVRSANSVEAVCRAADELTHPSW